MNPKSILKSKTFWVNLVVGVAALLNAFPNEYTVEGLAVANIVLRTITKQPVTATLN